MQYFLIYLTISLLLPCTSFAQDIDSIITRVQKVYDGIQDMKAGFIQETTSAMLKDAQKAEGIVYLKKPNMMRWEFSNPNKPVPEGFNRGDVIAGNGETIWIYQSDLGQVIVSKLTQIDKSISQHLLSGLVDMKKDFNVKLGDGTIDTYTLILTPKTELLNIKKIHIIIDKNTSFVKSTKSFDALGNTASVRFTDVSYNLNLKNAIFNFDVPKGVRVIIQP